MLSVPESPSLLSPEKLNLKVMSSIGMFGGRHPPSAPKEQEDLPTIP